MHGANGGELIIGGNFATYSSKYGEWKSHNPYTTKFLWGDDAFIFHIFEFGIKV